MKRTFLEEIFHRPRDFLGNRFVYTVISQRAGGLAIGINMNPDQMCNFDCLYCEIKRNPLNRNRTFHVKDMSKELKTLLGLIQLGKMREFPGFTNVPHELLALKNIDLSGDGEPTFCPYFSEVVKEILLIRANPQFPHFKLVLITNGTGLHLPRVQEGLRLFSKDDEIWVKLEAGTQGYMHFVNQTTVPMQNVLDNILQLGRQRSIVIQSLFPSIHGEGPSDSEIEAFVQRLADLKRKGAIISLVQIYSVARPPARPDCTHLPLKRLSYIAQRVRKMSGLKAEVY